MKQTMHLAVLGDPVEHSLSPQIHGAFGRQFGIDVDYRKIQTTSAALDDRLKTLVDAGVQGVNLTVPLKASGIRLCQHIDTAARRARAVNTLHFKNGGWSGHNTDGPGLLMDFERLGIHLPGKRILVIGAGGAASGIIAPMMDAEPSGITILNRTASRAVELAERFEHLGPVCGRGLDQADESIRDYDLLIQTTSAGHSGQLPPLRRHWLTRKATVYDLNYGPAHTALQRWAQAYDLDCHDGLGMLVGQAALAFEIWSGQRPSMDDALALLR